MYLPEARSPKRLEQRLSKVRVWHRAFFGSCRLKGRVLRKVVALGRCSASLPSRRLDSTIGTGPRYPSDPLLCFSLVKPQPYVHRQPAFGPSRAAQGYISLMFVEVSASRAHPTDRGKAAETDNTRSTRPRDRELSPLVRMRKSGLAIA